MRALFILLLLANAGFFAWQYQIRGLADHDATRENFQPTDPGVTPLILLSERAPAPAAAPIAEAAPLAAADGGYTAVQPDTAADGAPAAIAETEQRIEPVAEPDTAPAAAPAFSLEPTLVRQCLELGPSTDRAAIEQAAAAARQAGARASLRENVQTGTAGYWVRLPEYFPSFGSARARYRELQQMGIDDIAIVPLPDQRYFISLGVYKRKDTVEERRAEILARGITPVIEDRAQTATSYTLVVEHEGVDPAALSDRLAGWVPEMALREVACE